MVLIPVREDIYKSLAPTSKSCTCRSHCGYCSEFHPDNQCIQKPKKRSEMKPLEIPKRLEIVSGACRFAFLFIVVTQFSINWVSGDLIVRKVFGPEVPTGKYKHPSSFDELDNGDLYLAYYGGAGEYSSGTVVYGARLNKGSSHWSQPKRIAGNPFRSLGNPVVWQGPDGLVWLFYVTRFGDTWSTSRIKVKISRDGAVSWSDSALLTIEPGTMVRAHPIVLQTGEYLLPIYHETGHDTELVGPGTTSFFLRYNPSNKKWSSSKRIRSDHGNLQPAVAQVDDRHLIAYCRRGGGYEPTTEGYLIRSESRDGGHTWGKGTNSSFPNPNSAVDFIKLRSGRLLLVYNHNMNDRTPLTAALSSDNGKTFPHRMNIAAGQGSFAYPTVVQTRNGKIHVTFTSQERTQINHAIFDENDLLSKPDKKK